MYMCQYTLYSIFFSTVFLWPLPLRECSASLPVILFPGFMLQSVIFSFTFLIPFRPPPLLSKSSFFVLCSIRTDIATPKFKSRVLLKGEIYDVFVSLTCFTKHNYLQFQSFSWKCQNFVLFVTEILRCVSMPHFLVFFFLSSWSTYSFCT